MLHKFIRASLAGAMALISVSAFADIAPFSLPWMNQSPRDVYKMENHPNGVFVLEMYFRTCPYCNDNAPNVDRLSADHAGEPRVQVLDVGIDRNDVDYDRWIQAHHPNHPVLKDANRVIAGEL